MQDDRKKIGFVLSADLVERFKAKAVEDGIGQSKLAEQLLQEALATPMDIKVPEVRQQDKGQSFTAEDVRRHRPRERLMGASAPQQGLPDFMRRTGMEPTNQGGNHPQSSQQRVHAPYPQPPQPPVQRQAMQQNVHLPPEVTGYADRMPQGNVPPYVPEPGVDQEAVARWFLMRGMQVPPELGGPPVPVEQMVQQPMPPPPPPVVMAGSYPPGWTGSPRMQFAQGPPEPPPLYRRPGRGVAPPPQQQPVEMQVQRQVPQQQVPQGPAYAQDPFSINIGQQVGMRPGLGGAPPTAQSLLSDQMVVPQPGAENPNMVIAQRALGRNWRQHLHQMTAQNQRETPIV